MSSGTNGLGGAGGPARGNRLLRGEAGGVGRREEPGGADNRRGGGATQGSGTPPSRGAGARPEAGPRTGTAGGSVRLLSAADLGRATEVASAAFRDDPFWLYLVPDGKKRGDLLPRFFGAALALGAAGGRLHGVSDPVEGIAVWEQPGQGRAGPKDVIDAGLPGALLGLGPLLVPALRSPRALRVFAAFGEMRKERAQGPYYYLQTIAVSPEAQGKGLASRLIEPFLARADERSFGAYTETTTPSNVGLYERYGFEVVDRRDVPGTGLSAWAFYRPGAPTGEAAAGRGTRGGQRA